MQFGDLSIEVAGHDTLTQQFEAVHFGLDAASQMIAAPAFPDCPSEASGRANGFIAGLNAGGVLPPWPRVPASGYDRTGIACGNGFVAGSCVVGPIGADCGDGLILGDLVQQFRQHGGIAHSAAGNLNGADVPCLGIEAEVDLAPLTGLGRAVFAGEPLTIARCLDPSAVDQQVQRTRGGSAGNFNDQGLLPPTERAEVRHRPIEPCHLQQARHQPRGLAQRQPEQRLQR